jgi:hypothetical protein
MRHNRIAFYVRLTSMRTTHGGGAYPTKLKVGSGNDDTIRGFAGSFPLIGARIFMRRVCSSTDALWLLDCDSPIMKWEAYTYTKPITVLSAIISSV